MKLSKILALLFFNLVLFGSLSAQVSDNSLKYGKLVIQLRDLCGNSIEKALVKIQGSELKRKFKSNKQGKVEISLPIKKYNIEVEKYGFKIYIVNNIEVNEENNSIVKLDMEEGYASDDPKAPAVWKCPSNSKSSVSN